VSEPLLLGIDLGSESARVGAFTPAGERVAAARQPLRTAYPREGWAEQDVGGWWPAVAAAARAAVAQAGPGRVAGIGVSTTASTVVALDAAGHPLRPAILWMDNRAVEQTRRTAACEHPVLRWSGGADAVEWLVPKAMWLAEHEPEVYAAADRLVEAVDYLNFRLTGEWTASQLNATCKWNYDPTLPGFHDDLYAELGVPDLPARWPREVVPVGGPVGALRPGAAADLGLPPGLPVLQGGIDAHVGMLGTDTLAGGRVTMVAGTSIVHLVLADHEVRSDGIWGPYPDALLPGTWLIEGGQVSAGSILRWYVHEILGAGDDAHERLMAEAARLPAGADGLVVCDFWQGNRTPYRDARLRGTVTGLTLHHTRAHLYRAIVEAVACGSRNVLEAFAAAGLELGDVVVSGGICANPLWLQVTADVCGRELLLPREPNASLLGAAVAAAAGVGLHPSLRAAARAMSRVERAFAPDPEAHARCEELFARYLEAVAATRSLVRDAPVGSAA
jgi:FGGY-family pentulose kinase